VGARVAEKLKKLQNFLQKGSGTRDVATKEEVGCRRERGRKGKEKVIFNAVC